MNTKVKFGLAVFMIASLMGCVSSSKRSSVTDTISVVAAPAISIETLKRSDFKIIGPVSGKVCVSLDEMTNDVINDEKVIIGNTAYGQSISDITKEYALYQALESLKDADLILAPRYRVQITKQQEKGKDGFKSVKTICCVWVSGKAIALKADQ